MNDRKLLAQAGVVLARLEELEASHAATIEKFEFRVGGLESENERLNATLRSAFKHVDELESELRELKEDDL